MHGDIQCVTDSTEKIDNDKYKFFGEQTFREWEKENSDFLLVDSIKEIHNIYPKESYEEIAGRLSLTVVDTILISKKLENEFGIKLSNEPINLYPAFKEFISAHKICTRMNNLEVKDVEMESHFLDHIKYLIDNGIVKHNSMSEYIRAAVEAYTFTYPIIKKITNPDNLMSLEQCFENSGMPGIREEYIKHKVQKRKDQKHKNQKYNREIKMKGIYKDIFININDILSIKKDNLKIALECNNIDEILNISDEISTFIHDLILISHNSEDKEYMYILKCFIEDSYFIKQISMMLEENNYIKLNYAL